jgi:putative NADH-flavin reductase
MKIILFGATGMVGQAALRECLRDEGIEAVLAIGRTPTGQTHAKLKELIRKDMFDFNAGDTDLRNYDACFFCLGVSSAGMKEVDYTRLTFDLTMGWAQTLAAANPAMTFIYVSGAGTGGKAKWAQVKGRTEYALLDLFDKAYMFRLAALEPVHGERSKTTWTRVSYSLFFWLFPIARKLFPSLVITTEELGRAMIRVAREGASKRILENRNLIALGQI